MNTRRATVGLSVRDQRTTVDLYYMLRSIGATPLLYQHSNPRRWHDLVSVGGRERIVCVIDDDPDLVIQATSLGVDGVIYDRADNQHFSWHLRAQGIADARRGISRLLAIWRAKQQTSCYTA
jgi:hypothetical protein